MAPTTPIGEPTSARAGDSWIWKQSFTEYPVSEGWGLAYTFKGPGELTTQSAEITNDGSVTYTVTIPASRTDDLAAGTYAWFAVMTGSGAFTGRRDTVASGTLTVLPDLATVDPADVRLPEEKLLAAIDAVIYGRVTDDVQEVEIAGRSIVKIPVMELFAIKSRLERKIATARNGGRAGVARIQFA